MGSVCREVYREELCKEMFREGGVGNRCVGRSCVGRRCVGGGA